MLSSEGADRENHPQGSQRKGFRKASSLGTLSRPTRNGDYRQTPLPTQPPPGVCLAQPTCGLSVLRTGPSPLLQQAQCHSSVVPKTEPSHIRELSTLLQPFPSPYTLPLRASQLWLQMTAAALHWPHGQLPSLARHWHTWMPGGTPSVAARILLPPDTPMPGKGSHKGVWEFRERTGCECCRRRSNWPQTVKTFPEEGVEVLFHRPEAVEQMTLIRSVCSWGNPCCAQHTLREHLFFSTAIITGTPLRIGHRAWLMVALRKVPAPRLSLLSATWAEHTVWKK